MVTGVIQTIWEEMGYHLIVGTIVLGFLFYIIKKTIDKMYHSHGGFFNAYPIKIEAEKNNVIFNELVELRAVTEADRVFVFRFHNGTEFLPSNPAWKFSCTHEVVKPGVSYEAPNLQGMLVSLIFNIIGVVLTGSSDLTGIAVKDCSNCPHNQKCIEENKRIVIIQTEDMNNSYCLHHLESQNIKTSVLCGIARKGNVYGLVGIDFCGKSVDHEEVLRVAEKLCRTTDNIQFQLIIKK